MEATYGAKFATQWAGTDIAAVKRQWGVDLGELTPDELRRGVAGLRTCRFPPTLPEFFDLCRPAPNIDAALHDAAQQLRLRAEGRDEWPNPALYWAAVKVGEYDMQHQSHAMLVKRFAAALDEVMRGEVLPVPKRVANAAALPAPGKSMADKAKVAGEVAKLRDFGKGAAPGKAWAHRVLERVKAGDKTLSTASIGMARAAMGGKA